MAEDEPACRVILHYPTEASVSVAKLKQTLDKGSDQDKEDAMKAAIAMVLSGATRAHEEGARQRACGTLRLGAALCRPPLAPLLPVFDSLRFASVCRRCFASACDVRTGDAALVSHLSPCPPDFMRTLRVVYLLY